MYMYTTIIYTKIDSLITQYQSETHILLYIALKILNISSAKKNQIQPYIISKHNISIFSILNLALHFNELLNGN